MIVRSTVQRWTTREGLEDMSLREKTQFLPLLFCVAIWSTPGCVSESPVGESQFEQVTLSDYYLEVKTNSGAALRKSLHEKIDDHLTHPYSAVGTDAWDILEEAQRNSEKAGNYIRDIYRDKDFKISQAFKPYNREHSWPKSYGFPAEGSANLPHNDCHAMFLADGGYNSSRGNRPYQYCTENCIEKPTDHGDMNLMDHDVWETWAGRRGDVARALFYMDIRYEGGKNATTNHWEPDLRLTDSASQIIASKVNRKIAYMGFLSVLLEWHQQDPPDAFETQRNDTIYSYQGNRNPFIDHPEWAECVYLDLCDGWSDLVATPLYFTELHYDNSGNDQGEFIEIRGAPGASLSGWRVVAYGDNGKPYDQRLLSGKLSAKGHLAVSFPEIQNGDSDGFALVDAMGGVWDAISYEGDFVGATGPAASIIFSDIGVVEDDATPLGYSLQRTGDTWIGPVPSTRGTSNLPL